MAGPNRLTFDYLVETNFTAESMMATLSSTSGGTSSLNLLTATRTNMGGGFGTQGAEVGSLVVNANAGDTLTVHLAMVNGRDAGANPQSVVADNFRLSKVPEPTSVLLGLIGVVGLLGLGRRR
jgi:PEP-CTERM motif